MSTQKQIQANRLNSQLSTGPKSVRGKAVVASNALKHGIFTKQILLDDESEEDFKALEAEFIAHFQPEGLLERLLLERALIAAWRLSRIGRLESTLMDRAKKDIFSSEANLADAFGGCSGDKLALISRYEVSLERILFRSIAELRNLKSSQEFERNEAAVEIGFVSQKSGETEVSGVVQSTSQGSEE